jgi:Protein of unknown function (DUF1203)
MSFQILPLPAEPFRPLYGLSADLLAERGVLRRVAATTDTFPCRVSLRHAAPGEAVLLLNYEHLPLASPYRARHAIFVRDGAEPFCPVPGVVPEILRCRLLSIRAYDEGGIMLDADIVDGSAVEPVLERFLDNGNAAFLHVHNAKQGCFAARVERAAR